MEVIKKYLVCFLLSITLFVPTNYAVKSDCKEFKVTRFDSKKSN